MAIAIKEKQQIEKAVAKAKAVKPRVKVLGYSHFEVVGAKGDSYTVTFKKADGGKGVEGNCTCQAGRKSRSVCYHIAACAGIAKQQVMERASARLTCQEGECQLAAVDGSDYCEFHTELSEMSRIYSTTTATKLYELNCPNCGHDFTSPKDCFFCPTCEEAAQLAKDEYDLFG